MKKKSIISLLICCMTFGMVATSCEDMLSPNSERHSYEIAQDTLYSYWGILKSLQNVGERYVILGECRGDLVDGTSYLSDSISTILNFDMANATDGSNRYLKASDYYHIINSCNAYLAKADTTRLTGTLQPYMMKEYAQVEAIRAWTYLQLVQVYGEVPFYTDPLLTTDDINAFMNNPSHQKATADNLADLLVDRLTRAEAIEKQYGYPSYESYGYTSTVCHSTKAMIPLNLILGDLYLTKGDAYSCQLAAQYYYNYLGNNQGAGNIEEGGALPDGYNNIGYKSEGADKPEYEHKDGTPWTETGEQDKEKESITAIPSSTNKLWGTVQRGVNELFGYASEISVRTSEEDTTTTASVSLTPQYDKKQLRASQNYFDMCKAQNYEIYIGDGKDINTLTLVTDPEVGDARQYWVKDVRQTYSNGVSNTEKFVTKQNPNGAFTTVYPMIYRKSMVWLRYAEALNRAGYPSYAFAILKNGLCNNSTWYPDEDKYYEVLDSTYQASYVDEEGTEHTFPTDGSTYNTQADITAAMETAGLTVSDYTISGDTICTGYTNYPNEGLAANIILNYLDKREAVNPPSFLNFKFDEFDGQVSSQSIVYRTSLTQRGTSTIAKEKDGDDNVTVGIHSHGCGILKYDEQKSSYNYVDQIIAKAKANYGTTLTKEDIYSGEYDDVVKNCVEDLIVDEEAMELAFEGTRFFDLMRVAHRRSDASYLANRLAKRNSALASKLLNTKNWYFPLPND